MEVAYKTFTIYPSVWKKDDGAAVLADVEFVHNGGGGVDVFQMPVLVLEGGKEVFWGGVAFESDEVDSWGEGDGLHKLMFLVGGKLFRLLLSQMGW